MNVSAFSNDDFDSKAWINKTFEAPEAQENREAYAEEVVFRLEHFIQEMNAALEDTAVSVQRNALPRVLRDIDAMKRDVNALQQVMRDTQDDIQRVQRNATESMKTLMVLDRAKERLQETNNALSMADNWTTLSNEAQQAFQAGDVSVIREKLCGMEHSLSMLKNVPDYEDRCNHLEQLKNQLEALLSPQMVRALKALAVDDAKTFVAVFASIHRLPQVIKYYQRTVKTSLIEEWQRCSSNTEDESFADWLTAFYDILLSEWHRHTAFSQLVFPQESSVRILSEVYVDVAKECLTPAAVESFVHRFQQRPNDDAAADPIGSILSLVEQTARFGKSLEMSVGNDAEHTVHIAALAKALFSMFPRAMDLYGQLEEKYLLRRLSDINVSASTIMDTVSHMDTSVRKVWQLCVDACDRCIRYTQGCLLPSSLRAQKALWRHYIDRCRTVLFQLKAAPSKENIDHWACVTLSLKCLESCGAIIMKIEDLDSRIMEGITHELQNSQNSEKPFADFQQLLSPTAKTALDDFVASKFSPMDDTLSLCRKLCADFGRFVFDSVLMSPIQTHLKVLPTLKIWTEEDIPSFAQSPLEYVTQIGQYLLTLPQHIEAFADSAALAVALRNLKLAHGMETFVFPTASGADMTSQALLTNLVHGASFSLIDAIMQIQRLTVAATQQLATDVSYLVNVFDDLGVTPPETLLHVRQLLQCSPSEFHELEQKMSIQLTHTIRAIRGIEQG